MAHQKFNFVKANRLTTRDERDIVQRRAAKEKYRAARKELPKKVRARDVRDERLAMRESMLFSQVEEQGFGQLLGAGVALYGGLRVAPRLGRVVSRTARLVDSLLSSATRTSNNVNTLIEEILKLFKTVSDTAKAIVGKLWVLPIAVLGYWLINKFAGNSAAKIVLLTVLGLVFGKQLWSQIRDKFSGEEVSEQSGLNSPFKSLIVGLMCFSFLPRDAGKLISTLMTRISMVPRLKDGIDGLFEVCIKLAESVVNLVHRIAGSKDANGKTTEVFFGDASTKCVKKWIQDSAFHMEKLVGVPTPALVKDAHAHIRKGYALLQVIKEVALSNILKRAIDNLEVKVAPFMGVVTAGKNFRPEPHFVLFSGESGVGKSSILIKFVVSVLLLSGLCDPEEVLSNLWQKGSSEYWNGYVNQLCVVMDDVFQKVTAKGSTESEYMDIIRMISNWSFPLNMADLNSKGKFYFDSPLVVGTTNAANVYDTTYKEAVAKPEAVVRRIHDVVYMRASSGYAKEDHTMNYEKLELTFRSRLAALRERDTPCSPEDIVDAIPWDAWEASKANFVDFTFPSHATELVDRVDLKTLVVQVAERLKLKQQYHSESLASLEEFATLLGQSKVEVQSGLDEFVMSFGAIEDQFTPDLEDRKMRVLTQKFARDYDSLIRPFVNDKLKSVTEPSIVAFYRTAMIKLISLFNTPQLIPLSLEAQAFFQSWCELFDQDGKYSGFFTCEGLDYAGLLHRVKFILHVLTNFNRAKHLGMSATKLTALYSWFKDLSTDFKAHFDLLVAVDAETSRQTSIVSCAKAFIFGMWSSLKRLDISSTMTKYSCALACVAVLSLLVRCVYRLLKTVFKGVCGLLGIAPRQVQEPKEELAKGTPVEQGNHVAVLQDEKVYDKIYENLYTLVLPRTERVIGQMLFVSSHLAVMPNHFDRQIREGLESGLLSEADQISAHNGAMKYAKIVMTIKQFLSVDRYHDTKQVTDTIFLQFPKESNFMGKSTIVQHFASEEGYLAIGRGLLPVRMDWTRLVMKDGTVKMQRVGLSAPLVKKEYRMPVGPITPPFVWSSSMTTRPGDCGAPLMIARRSSTIEGRCILGIHVAGNTCPIEPKACAIPVSREMVLRAVEHFKTIEDRFVEDLRDRGIDLEPITVEEQAGLAECGLVAGSFELLGVVSKPVSVAPKSRISHTPLCVEEPFGPSGLQIAHLRPTLVGDELKYPMVEGIKNYQSPLEWRDIPDIDHIVSVAMQRFGLCSVHDSRDVLSFEDAVRSPELMKLKAINRATSPGYPYVLDGEPGKTKWFGKDGEYDLTNEFCEELCQRCQHIADSARDSKRLSHICIDFLKDETRPDAKVEACATRVISASPMDYVIVFRQYFGSFMAAMFRNHTRSGFTPGINPYQEWWILAGELAQAGDNHFDGDFSRFDASEQPYIHWAILRYINGWYNDGPENARIREVLFMDVVHSRHLTSHHGPLRYVVQWNKSLPSGHAITTPLNSIYAMVALVLCYARLVGDPSNFWEKCYAATNGDDNVVTASDDVKEMFNQVTVSRAMKEHLGLTYTSGAKDGKLIPYKPLTELVFLKRAFKLDKDNIFAKGGWLAPLEFQSFLYTAYFTRAKKDVGADICANLEFALCEMCMHDEAVWIEYSPKIFAIMTRFGGAPKYGYTRPAYMQFMSRRTDFWY